MGLYDHLLRTAALPAISLITESRFWDLYLGLRRPSQDNGIAPSSDVRQAKLLSLWEHAYRNVPFYRERMDACGLPPGALRSFDDLQALPPVTKHEVAANFPDRITDAAQQFKPWRYRASSGTIERLTVIHDSRKRDFVRASEMLALYSASGYQAGMKYLEIPPDVCRNVCGTQSTTEPHIVRYLWQNAKRLRDPEVVSDLRGLTERQVIYRRRTLPSFDHHGAVQRREALDAYLAAIRQYSPAVVKALPLYLYALALHILDTGAAAPLKTGVLMPMGSSLTAHMRARIEAAFGLPVHQDYGCSELGAIAAECGHQSGVHPFAALFHVEVVRNGRPARPGELGKVLITDLSNYAMPFIRYDIGDVAVVRNGTCQCGRNLARLELQGRVQDCLTAEDGSQVSSDAITDALLACPGVRLFRLDARSRTEIALQIVPEPGKQPDFDAVRDALAGLLGRSVKVTWRTTPTILPEASGKFRLVRNERPEREIG